MTNVSTIIEATRSPKEERRSSICERYAVSEDKGILTIELAEAVLKGLDVRKKWCQDKMSGMSPCMHVSQESDMCDSTEWRDAYMQMEFEDLTGEALDAELVREGCREEIEMFHTMAVYAYVERPKAEKDPLGKLVG